MARPLIAGLLALAACTRPNPESCLDGFCNDPRFPYCDSGGELGGVPGACIEVTCEPQTFETCRGDVAISCNATGDSYENLECALGCDASAGGCRKCEPSQTACTNGEVATCDAQGTVIESTPCPLGCFEDEPRCREIDPSNDLAMYLDMVPNPPDVALTDGYFLATDSGSVSKAGGPDLTIPNFLIVTPGPTPDIRVFVVSSLSVDGEVRVYGDYERGETPSPALAVVAKNDISIRGNIRVFPTAGEVTGPACTAGAVYYAPRSNNYLYVASGGGANATAGGAGGGVSTPDYEDSAGGLPIGSDDIVPLQGGCSAGGFRSVAMPGSPTTLPGTGGGAIQLTSRTRIDVSGVVDVRGYQGAPVQGDGLRGVYIFGGGAGGSVLLEAPVVTLSVGARLIAKGGRGGAQGASNTGSTADDAAPNPGAVCAPAGPRCGDGGAGAAPGQPAGKGVTATHATNVTDVTFQGGGGGGGLGRVRINTRDGSYSKTNDVVEAAVVTTGALKTR